MDRATAYVPTAHGGKYVQQLCKHWAHKLDVEWTPDRGIVRFERAIAIMTTGAEELDIRIEAEDSETLERMKSVVASHLDRFAFREAPLAFDWRAGPEAA